MAVMSVPTSALFLSHAHNDEIPLKSWSAIHQAAQQKPPPTAGARPEGCFGLLGVGDASIGKGGVHVARDFLPACVVVLASVGQLNAGFGC